MITRRRLLVGSACAFCASPDYGNSKHRLTCVLYDKDPQDSAGGLFGLGRLDLNTNDALGLGIILKDLSDELEIKPTFAMYDDDASNPNALSSQTTLSPEILGQSEYGTVALGRKMLAILKWKYGDLYRSAVTATCAHEYGHILQFKTLYSLLQRLPGGKIRIELHADFVSGYYGAHRKRIDPQYDALTQAVTQFEAGDKETGDEGYHAVSHGTFEQRGDAVYAGFLLGFEGKKDPKIVAEKGLDYVRSVSL